MAIFSFSEQDGDTSGSLSMRISQLGMELWNEITARHWSDSMILQMAEYFEHPVRKLAHFTEYAIMGILIHSMFLYWDLDKMKWKVVSILWVALSATADEFHQYFVPGRCASIWDVLLDTVGGIVGILICVFLVYQSRKKQNQI